MDYANYVNNITFRLIRPHTKLPRRFMKLLNHLARVGLPLESWITRLPEDEQAMRRTLRKVCRVPKMSTFSIGAMINRGVSHMSDEHVFVNIGVWHGFTFLCGLINNSDKTCVGIDNFSRKSQRGEREKFPKRFNRYKSAHHHFFETDYRDYFANMHKGTIGFLIYDAKHTYELQLEALEIAEPFFSKDCIILIDDTNDDPPRHATMDFIANSSNRYKILLDRTTSRKPHPTLWNGIIIFQRIG